MKNEKHIALAKEIKHKHTEWVQMRSDYFDLEAAIVAALQQVERDALASKVVGPSDEKINKAALNWCAENQYNDKKDRGTSFIEACHWLRSQLTLAPKEPTKECQCEELKQMIQKAQDNLKKNMELLTAPNEQVIRVPKIKKSWYDPSYGHGGGSWVDEICEHNDVIKAIKRLNPQARIEESDE